MNPPVKWTIDEIVEATGGDLSFAACTDGFADIRIDSRQVQAGDVFVAIEGPRFDGHDFIEEVTARKASCVVIARNKTDRFFGLQQEKNRMCCIAVDDTTRALGGLAAYKRRQAAVPVVAITGSAGKTTTREMTMAICRRCFETLSTSGNFNNEIGLPLTMFGLEAKHELVLLELGMNHPGEIGYLSKICSPDIGVITNTGPAHLEGLKDVHFVALAKGELLENIRPEGVAVLNADDDYSAILKEIAGSRRVVMFGTGGEAQIRAENIRQQTGRASFSLVMPEAVIDINLNVYGYVMIKNALAAAAVAHLLEIGAEDIKAGLESFRPVEGRMVIYETPAGVYIIDDTYNANPMSMEAAIDSLKGLAGQKRKILVAGDMLELGVSAQYYHEKLGQKAADANIARLYLTGEYAGRVAQGAKSAGIKRSNIFVGTKTDIIKDLSGWLERGDWILVKGSRSTGMEDIVRQMTADARVREQSAET